MDEQGSQHNYLSDDLLQSRRASGRLIDGLKLSDTLLKQRLRLLYSTACYGATHAPDFIRAGFRVASGATRTNANGPYDYPTQLACWGRGWTYRSTVNLANSPIFIAMHDAIAKLLGFDDVNSEKMIEGRKHTRITTPAD